MARDALTPAERMAIDAAVKAGKVTVLPPGPAAGLSPLEAVYGAVPPREPKPWREGNKAFHVLAHRHAKGGGGRS